MHGQRRRARQACIHREVSVTLGRPRAKTHMESDSPSLIELSLSQTATLNYVQHQQVALSKRLDDVCEKLDLLLGACFENGGRGSFPAKRGSNTMVSPWRVRGDSRFAGWESRPRTASQTYVDQITEPVGEMPPVLLLGGERIAIACEGAVSAQLESEPEHCGDHVGSVPFEACAGVGAGESECDTGEASVGRSGVPPPPVPHGTEAHDAESATAGQKPSGVGALGKSELTEDLAASCKADGQEGATLQASRPDVAGAGRKAARMHAPHTAAALPAGLPAGLSQSKLVSVLAAQQSETRRGSLMRGPSGTGVARHGASSPTSKRLGGLALTASQKLEPEIEEEPGSEPQQLMHDASGSEHSREGRLKMFLTQDPDVENLLTEMRRREGELQQTMERQNSWEKSNPLSAYFILLPNSTKRARWDSVMLILLLFSAVIVPIDVGYQLDKGFVRALIALDVFFMIDVLVGFRTAFTSSNHIVKLPARIAKRYAHGWLAVDLTAAIPLNIVYAALNLDVGLPWYVDIIKLVRIVRLLKLPRVLGSNRVFRRWRMHVTTAVFQLLSALMFLLFIFHLMGCLYVTIVRFEVDDLLQHSTESRSSTVCELVREGLFKAHGSWLPPCNFFRVVSDTGGSVTVSPGIDMYFFSVWWAMCAMSGTQVSIPHTDIEVVFTSIVVLSGFLVGAYVIGTFTTALSQLAAASNFERQKRDYIDQYLTYKRIPKALRWQVQQFYQFAGFEEGGAMLDTLPVSLRLKLELVLSRNLFLKVPFFKNCDLSQITVMVPLVHHEYVWPGKTVQHEGASGTGLYMVGRGFSKTSAAGRLKSILTYGDFYGEESLLSDVPSAVTVQTITLCQFEVLPKADFLNVIELYPQVKRQLVRYAASKKKRAHQSSSSESVAQQMQRVHIDLQRNRGFFSKETKTDLMRTVREIYEISKSTSPSSARRSSWLIANIGRLRPLVERPESQGIKAFFSRLRSNRKHRVGPRTSEASRETCLARVMARVTKPRSQQLMAAHYGTEHRNRGQEPFSGAAGQQSTPLSVPSYRM